LMPAVRALVEHPLSLEEACLIASWPGEASAVVDDGDTISQKIVFETEREINHDPAIAAKAATPFLDVLASIRQP